jgi:LacI family transcriptional regulator
MGFDDIYEDTLVTPELTTNHVPVEQMANQATYQLQKQISATQWNPQKVLVRRDWLNGTRYECFH